MNFQMTDIVLETLEDLSAIGDTWRPLMVLRNDLDSQTRRCAAFASCHIYFGFYDEWNNNFQVQYDVSASIFQIICGVH